ncbi:MAG: epoxyqueuosine reductase QueH [Actinobacteria bacterium]|nr:epoxyqueuosine reductase QueH [Actinomycetota bacterium]
MRLLLHVCCGPCAAGTLDHHRAAASDVVGFFYNPNIHPFMEYRSRLAGVRDLAAARHLPIREDLWFDPEQWFEAVRGGPEERCRRCLALRLGRAAEEALAAGADAFATTLAVSPWQDHAAIEEEGASAGDAAGVVFVYEDLRHLYADSRRVARELALYRQRYCGCLISEWERHRDQR